MAGSYGFDLLRDQLIDHLAAEIDAGCASAEAVENYGTTPIEKLLFYAVLVRLKYIRDTWHHQCVYLSDNDQLAGMQGRKDAQEFIIVQKQLQLPEWRVDFVFNAYASWRRNEGAGTVGWKRLIVECDGHDFHERTKEQAAKDRSRDRYAQENGFEIFRFTGSEIWRDPIGCAKQIIEWAESKL